MSRPDEDVVKGMLQALEHTLDTVDVVSVAAGQLLNAQKTNNPLAPSTLAHYEEQLADRRDR